MADFEFSCSGIRSFDDFPPDFRSYLVQENYSRERRFNWWIFNSIDSELFTTMDWKTISRFLAIPNALVQFWKAIPKDGRCLLTTQDQPFILHQPSEALCSYRLACKNYEFYGDNKGEEEGRLGIPGRVFKYRSVESTPNVLHYTIQEYPQRDEALRNGIKLSLAFPVFELSNKQCVGVLKLMTTSTYISPLEFSYMDIVLERLIKRSGLELQLPNVHYISHERQTSLGSVYKELEEALREACTNPAVLVAQAWETCNDCKALFDRDTTDTSYLGLWWCEFNKAIPDQISYLYHRWPLDCIREGQGIAGMAFSSRKLSLCTEISQFGIIDYPFKHYAIEIGCNGSFAICLHCNYTGNHVFVLEFSFKYDADAHTLIYQVLKEMKKYLLSFRVTSGQELGEELPILIIDSWINNRHDFIPLLEEREQVQQPSSDAMITVRNDVIQEPKSDPNSCSQQARETKATVRQHRKSGIPISLDDIKQQSGKKLDDAAESLSVSRSTFKRACREYGILWWQSGKRKRDNPSTFCDASVGEATQGQVPGFIMPSSSIQPLEPPMALDTFRMQHSMPSEIVNNVRDVNIKESASVEEVTQDQVPGFTIPSSSKQPHELPMALDTSRMQHSTSLEIVNNMNIKVIYGDKFAIRFQLSLSSGVEELQQEVVRRLNWVNFKTFSLHYNDKDNDWILIGCDDDLWQYMSSSTSLGKTTITLYLKQFNSSTLLGSQ